MHGTVSVQKPELLPGDKKLCMETGSLGRIKRCFSVVEKALVFMVGLPLLDHSAVPPCNKVEWEYFLITRARLLTMFLVNKRAAQFKEKVNSLLKIYLNCYSGVGGTQKNKCKKKSGNSDI